MEVTSKTIETKAAHNMETWHMAEVASQIRSQGKIKQYIIPNGFK